MATWSWKYRSRSPIIWPGLKHCKMHIQWQIGPNPAKTFLSYRVTTTKSRHGFFLEIYVSNPHDKVFLRWTHGPYNTDPKDKGLWNAKMPENHLLIHRYVLSRMAFWGSWGQFGSGVASVSCVSSYHRQTYVSNLCSYWAFTVSSDHCASLMRPTHTHVTWRFNLHNSFAESAWPISGKSD